MRGHDDHAADLSRNDGRGSGTGRRHLQADSGRRAVALIDPSATAATLETGIDWLARFERERGRPLRVLHIGNIANNAYTNAKIQRRRGIDADVCCDDYYHVMACPEWEDGEFAGNVVDELYPDWWNAGIGDFARPDWFAQGSLRACRAYLLSRRRDTRRRTELRRAQMTAERWLRCRSTRTARWLRMIGAVEGSGTGARRSVLVWARVRHQILLRRGSAIIRAVGALARGDDLRKAAAIALPTSLAPRRLRRLAAEESDELERRFRRHFPDRPDSLVRSDYADYAAHVSGWKPLLAEYDVVQAYALNAIIPLLCGTRAYAAYEHGTLREIPFEPTPRGRLCALSYREAPVVFVTNSDVLPSVERLTLDPERIACLPHAVDSDRLFRFADEHGHLAPPGEVTFYSPSRQDWVDGDVSWSKGNDRFFRAAALLAARGRAFRLVLAEWGRDVEASRRLLADLRLNDRVTWVPPVHKRELWTRYLQSHAVVDQFAVPAIGGVTFEAMALGCRVITAVDAEQTERFFGRAPTVLAAREPSEIADAMQAVLDDPGDTAGRGPAARHWFTEHHSAERIVELQAAAYRRLLE